MSEEVKVVVPEFPTESPVIELPADNPERRAQLERKLAEYKQRVKKWQNELGDSANFMAPEVLFERLGPLPYRIYILEQLLKNGRVETWSLSLELAKKWNDSTGKYFDSRTFDSACGLVKDYVETGGKNLFGGTGLK